MYTGGPPLDESFWHVTEHYDNIRKKFYDVATDVGACVEDRGSKHFPARVCSTPMKVSVLFCQYSQT